MRATMTGRAWWRVVVVVLGIAAVCSGGSASAQTGEVAAAAAREVALVQFFGGGSALLPAERAELEQAVARMFATDPQGARAAAAESTKMLALVQQWSGPRVAMGRELGRRAVAFDGIQALGTGGAGETAARIVAAHDPVVVSDPGRKLVVTMQTVGALVAGNRVGAPLFGLDLPGADAAVLAEAIRREWPEVDAGLREALATAGRDIPYAGPYLQAAAPAARARLISDYRTKIMAAPDAAGRQFRLAEVMAFAGATGYRNQGAGGGGGGRGANALSVMRQARLNQAMMDRAGRSLMPSCGVPAGATMGLAQRNFCQPSLMP